MCLWCEPSTKSGHTHLTKDMKSSLALPWICFLLNLVDEFIQDGIRPKQIGYFSFTKKAATEAANRAAEKFNLDIDNDLTFFRTLHSYAFNQLGMTREKMMGSEDYKEFGEKMWYSN